MATPHATMPLDVGRLFSVNGLVALITGGGSGIGFMMTKALVQGGASKVYIVGRRVDVLQAAAKTIDKPSVVVPLYCDVTSRVSLDSVMNIIQQDVGYLNLVVCNAGISGPQVPAPDPKTTTLEAWRDYNLAFNMDEYSTTMHVNTTSVWYTAMVMLKLLDQGNKKGNVEQSSQVVITGSVAAFNRKAPGGWAYGQSKAAASHIMRQLSVVLPTWNIRANCIAPGLFPSDMSSPIVHQAGHSIDSPGRIDIGTEVVPMGRMGDEQDMAGQILYLASRAGAYCNGAMILVDGGRLTTFPSTGP